VRLLGIACITPTGASPTRLVYSNHQDTNSAWPLFRNTNICLHTKTQTHTQINKQGFLGKTNCLLSFDTTETAQKTKKLGGHTDSKANS
jgi:hypothetical protein